MIFEASRFVFTPPPRLSWARRVLIKPSAAYPVPYPATTSPELLHTIIDGIRQVSDADIIIADETPDGSSVYPVYQALRYQFRRVLLLDVKDSVFIEMENPLLKFYSLPTFWAPNLAIRSDFLISVTPFKVAGRSGRFSIANLLGLLPVDRYRKGNEANWAALRELGMENVFADLYYTLPFDLGIIEARQMLAYGDDPTRGTTQRLDKILVGEPYEVDREASQLAGIDTGYLRLIDEARN
ncbi:MAG: DUF362 domain-containing protein, partial [Chloroflexota bacterium]